MATTRALIDGIIETDPDIDVQPFVDVAKELLDEHCVREPPYSTTRLDLIHTWLSAHFYTILDPRIASGSAGDIRLAFQSEVDLGLNTSHYGQQAMLLCPELADLNRRTTAKAKPILVSGPPSVTWLGTEEVTTSP